MGTTPGTSRVPDAEKDELRAPLIPEEKNEDDEDPSKGPVAPS